MSMFRKRFIKFSLLMRLRGWVDPSKKQEEITEPLRRVRMRNIILQLSEDRSLYDHEHNQVALMSVVINHNRAPRNDFHLACCQIPHSPEEYGQNVELEEVSKLWRR